MLLSGMLFADDLILFGNIPPSPALQRISSSPNVKSILIQEQAIGRIPVLFESQRNTLNIERSANEDSYNINANLPRPLHEATLSQTSIVMISGNWATEFVTTDTYTGVKQYGGTESMEYTYFLARDDMYIGKPISVTSTPNSISVSIDARNLPVADIPINIDVIESYGNTYVGSLIGSFSSVAVSTFTIPLNFTRNTERNQIVSIHMTNLPELSTQNDASYISAYFGWTGSVAHLTQYLKESKQRKMISIVLRLDLETGQIWD